MGTNVFTWDPTGHAYDFDSIMHYSAYASAKSWGNPVITYAGTMDPVETTYHIRGTFSETDIAEINLRYPCQLIDSEVNEKRQEIEDKQSENKNVSIPIL